MSQNKYQLALEKFRKLDQLSGMSQWLPTLVDATNLAKDAVQEDTKNGNAYVLLAMLLEMDARVYPELGIGYMRYLSQSAAVIYHWKINRIPTTDIAIQNYGNRIYNHISSILNEVFREQGGSNYFVELHKQFYQDALTRGT